ncbi:undecaprenyl-diphosphate phosphatase [bacterium]|nr:undecaprenyl-diphosphate phosphatase [bacterium]
MEYLAYALLGLIQGLTEFLPISSSGHLLLAQHWLGIEQPGVHLEVALHVATALAVIVVYRRDLARISKQRNWRYLGLLGLGTAITVAIALPLAEWVAALAEGEQGVRMTGGMLLVTAMWLLLADLRLKHPPRRRPLGYPGACFVGIAQAIALLPGVSRSGATIGMALQLGEERSEAARFSFLLSVPVILGAGALKAPGLLQNLQSGEASTLGLGIAFAAALASGIFGVHLLLKVLKQARLVYFAIYCTLLGGLAIILG